MDEKRQHCLEAAGFRFGNAEDFLGLTDTERRLVELWLAVCRAVRQRREKSGVTQQQLAAKLKSSQSRIAKIEAGTADVSLDLSFKALFAAGGNLADLTRALQPRKQPVQKAPAPAKRRKPAAANC